MDLTEYEEDKNAAANRDFVGDPKSHATRGALYPAFNSAGGIP